MDLVPTGGQLVGAAVNLAYGLSGGRFADVEKMPRSMIDQGDRRLVHQYVENSGASGDPVLLIAPLGASLAAYDLRRGGSLIEHLVASGRRPYSVEFGDLQFDEAGAFNHVVRNAIPAAIRAVALRSGGSRVHLVGWSVAGLTAMLAAADESLPIASVTSLGAAVNAAKVPLAAPARPLLDLPIPAGLMRLVNLAGGVPEDLAPLLAPAMMVRQLLDRPLAQLVNIDDRDFLAQLEAVDEFQQSLPFPPSTYGRIFHRYLRENALRTDQLEVGGEPIRLAEVRAPVLVIAGTEDQIAPLDAVALTTSLLSGAEQARIELVPGGHLGMLTGRRAPSATWPVIDDWLAEHDESAPLTVVRMPAKKAPPPRKAAKKAPPRKAAKTAPPRNAPPAKKTAPKSETPPKKSAKKAPAKKAATKKAAPTKKGPTKKGPTKKGPTKKAPPAKKSRAAKAEGIGANPERRYGSKSSRDLLGPKK